MQNLRQHPRELNSVLLGIVFLVTMACWGFLRGTNGEEHTCQCRRHKTCGFDLWVGKIAWRRAWQPTPVFLPGESHGQRTLVGYSPKSHKTQTLLKWLSTHMHELTISLPFAVWYCQWTAGFLVHKLDNQPQPTNQETYMYPWAFPSGYYLNYTSKVSQRGNIGLIGNKIRYKGH